MNFEAVRRVGKEKNPPLRGLHAIPHKRPGLRHAVVLVAPIWSGELLVDQVEDQPVLVTTRLAKDIPLAVRVLLGTDVQRLGFKVAYEKFGEGIWFPGYGGEFKLKAVFFYKRNIAIALRNSDFQRTAVSTRLVFYDLLEITQPLKLPEIPPRVLRTEAP